MSETQKMFAAPLMLPPDKTTNFYIEDLPCIYVRTGVIGDGSCFFHSYLRAFDPAYRGKNTLARTEAVNQLRERLADKVTLESFRTISNGEYRKMLFFGILRQLFEKKETLLPAKELINVLEDTTTYEDNFYVRFIKTVFSSLPKEYGNEDKRRFVEDIRQFFIDANSISIEHFRESLLRAEIGSTEVEFVARELKCNFIFLFSSEGKIQLYPFSAIIEEDWPYCIVLWVGESHYEIIGRKEENKTITRKFFKEDDIIKKYTLNNKSNVL